MERFVKLPGVVQVIGHGDTKSSVIVSGGTGRQAVVMNADLRVVSDEQFPFALHYFTGSKEHNIAMRQRAIDYGLKLNEYELAGAGQERPLQGRGRHLPGPGPGLHPAGDARGHRRDGGGRPSISLPKLIEADDIHGVFHNHTTWSDGSRHAWRRWPRPPRSSGCNTSASATTRNR